MCAETAATVILWLIVTAVALLIARKIWKRAKKKKAEALAKKEAELKAIETVSDKPKGEADKNEKKEVRH